MSRVRDNVPYALLMLLCNIFSGNSTWLSIVAQTPSRQELSLCVLRASGLILASAHELERPLIYTLVRLVTLSRHQYVTVKEKSTATIFGVNVTIVLNPLPKGVVFERNGHRLGDTTLGNVTTPGLWWQLTHLNYTTSGGCVWPQIR